MKKVICTFILIIATLLVFYQTTGFHFLKDWDDEWQVLNRCTANGFTLSNIQEIFSTFYNGQYSPLNQLSYTIIFIFNGLNPQGYHWANLVWHTGYICLVFFFIDKLLQLHTGNKNQKNTWIAFIVALFMALHPVQVETVAWISASKILTCSFFFMGSLVCYLSYLQSYKVRYYAGAAILFICSFLCKEQAVILPVCLVLIDWFTRRKLTDTAVIVEKAPFFALTICFILVTLYSYDQTFTEVVATDRFYTFPQRLAFSGFSLIEYVQKILLPVNLMYLYPYPMDVGDSLPIRFWIYPFVIPVFIFVIWHFRKKRLFLFGCLFFLIQLSFFLHIIPLPRFTITANRYLYIASLGFFLTLVWYAYHWIEKQNFNKKAICIFLALLFVCQGFYSYQTCKEWNNDRTLKARMKTILKERNCPINNS